MGNKRRKRRTKKRRAIGLTEENWGLFVTGIRIGIGTTMPTFGRLASLVNAGLAEAALLLDQAKNEIDPETGIVCKGKDE